MIVHERPKARLNLDDARFCVSKRSSLPVSNSKHKKQVSEINSNYKDKTKLSEYLEAFKSGDEVSLRESSQQENED